MKNIIMTLIAPGKYPLKIDDIRRRNVHMCEFHFGAAYCFQYRYITWDYSVMGHYLYRIQYPASPGIP